MNAYEPLLAEAQGFFSRFKGYMCSSESKIDKALLFKNCRSLHTCFMRFRIDMFCLDEDGRVIHIENEVAPWRFKSFHKVCHIIEVPSNKVSFLGFDKVSVGFEFPID